MISPSAEGGVLPEKGAETGRGFGRVVSKTEQSRAVAANHKATLPMSLQGKPQKSKTMKAKEKAPSQPLGLVVCRLPHSHRTLAPGWSRLASCPHNSVPASPRKETCAASARCGGSVPRSGGPAKEGHVRSGSQSRKFGPSVPASPCPLLRQIGQSVDESNLHRVSKIRFTDSSGWIVVQDGTVDAKKAHWGIDVSQSRVQRGKLMD